MEAERAQAHDGDSTDDTVEREPSDNPGTEGQEPVVPEKQMHRWNDDGGALPMED